MTSYVCRHMVGGSRVNKPVGKPLFVKAGTKALAEFKARQYWDFKGNRWSVDKYDQSGNHFITVEVCEEESR